jgi:hypothetical protein
MEIPKLGRKWAMCAAATLMGVSLFLYAVVNSVAGFVGMNLFEYWAQSRKSFLSRFSTWLFSLLSTSLTVST